MTGVGALLDLLRPSLEQMVDAAVRRGLVQARPSSVFPGTVIEVDYDSAIVLVDVDDPAGGGEVTVKSQVGLPVANDRVLIAFRGGGGGGALMVGWVDAPFGVPNVGWQEQGFLGTNTLNADNAEHDWPGGGTVCTVTHTKRHADTDLLIQTRYSATVDAANMLVYAYVRMDATTSTFVVYHFFNVASDHEQIIGDVRISGVAAGEHVWTTRILANSPGNHVLNDTFDRHSLTVTEVAPE